MKWRDLDVFDAEHTVRLERAFRCDGRACGAASGRSADGVQWHGSHWHIVIESVIHPDQQRWLLGVHVPLPVR
jgi:hypothetical protein